MEWKDLLDITRKYEEFLKSEDTKENANIELLRQQVQKTLFNNIMKTKTSQEKKETKKRMIYKTCGSWKTRESK